MMHMFSCMKAITVNVSEPTYRAFQAYAERTDRTTSELIREAMEMFREQRILSRRGSVLDIDPVSAGEVLRPLGPEDDLLEEMLGE